MTDPETIRHILIGIVSAIVFTLGLMIFFSDNNRPKGG